MGDQRADERTTDERFRALMEGLRTTLPGVQVLFAFLLTLPLQARFADISDVERAAYFVALTSAAVSSILLIAPSIHQRVRAPYSGIPRRHDAHLRFAERIGIVGSVFFLIALASALYTVTTVLFHAGWAMIPTVVAIAIAGWAWFWVPVVTWADDD